MDDSKKPELYHEETESKLTFSSACYISVLNSVYFFPPPDYN